MASKPITVSAKENMEQVNRTEFELLAYMSHELRSPMHGILGLIQLCQKMINKGQIVEEKLSHYLKTVENTSHQLVTTLTDLQEFSEYQCNPNFCRLLDHDLKEVIEAAFLESQPFLDEKQLILRKQFPNKPLLVHFDYEKMNFVFHHLLKHTIQSSPKGTEIIVACSPKQGSHDEISEPIIEIIIKNQCPDISEKNLTTLFDPFTQSKSDADAHGCRGLKLAICAEIIKAHQGKIWAEGHQQEGRLLVIHLPGKI